MSSDRRNKGRIELEFSINDEFVGPSLVLILTASATFVSFFEDFADPFVEKLSIATRGSISNICAVFALSIAISAKSWLSVQY